MSALSVASDGKEEGGVGGRAVRGSYENCSLLKQSDCNAAQHPTIKYYQSQ